MISPRLHPLVQLRPRHDVIYVSQNRTVLATGLNGFVETELSAVYSFIRAAFSHGTDI
jgi:hypothetical protein